MSRQITNKYAEGGPDTWHVASLSWSVGEVSRLKELLSQGLELREIASELRRTYVGTVYKAAAVLTLGGWGVSADAGPF